MTSFDPPAADVAEVVLLGPRYGEAICVHLGDNRWITIDSCLHGRSARPAALYYFDQIGVDPSNIEMIFATHWHDDHVRGLSQLVAASPGASVVIPEAMGKKEFVTLAAAYGQGALTSGIKELYGIYSSGRKLKTAGADKILLEGQTSAGKFEVWALSPSSEEFIRAVQAVGALIPVKGQPMASVSGRGPNHLAMVLLIKTGETNILLGADLEQDGSEELGWNAVLSTIAVRGVSCSLFKVPHHGSRTAYNVAVWEQVLGPSPVGVVTPFHHGRSKLPTDDEVARIKQHTPSLFITTKVPLARPKVKKSSLIENDIAQRTLNGLFVEPSEPGIIRCRTVVGESQHWQVGLMAGAAAL
ncbi:MBL fold metallo-hydrolase [Stenotrophomonas indicatrix]|uniref:MBL fold metallo-hydrolase n=1 Tax=Stenotrophomonas indicatrix TaxID=2045451 RepID=UPI00320A1989